MYDSIIANNICTWRDLFKINFAVLHSLVAETEAADGDSNDDDQHKNTSSHCYRNDIFGLEERLSGSYGRKGGKSGRCHNNYHRYQS